MQCDVSVLIVTYNSQECITGCLSSLRRAAGDCTYEVIVVDNASQDRTINTLQSALPQGRIIREGTNTGFARAVNRAASVARGEFLVLLNPDTILLDDALSSMVRFARAHPDYVAYGGRTLDGNGHLDPRSAWQAPSLWSCTCFALGLDRLPVGARWFDPERMVGWRRNSVRAVDIVTGCFLLIRRCEWERLGGFDPTYFLYGEDADLGLRIRAFGGRSVINPDAVLVHTVGASSSQRSDKMQLVLQGRATLFRHHWPRWKAALGVLALQSGAGLRAAAERLRARSDRTDWLPVWNARATWRAGFVEARSFELQSPTIPATEPQVPTRSTPKPGRTDALRVKRVRTPGSWR
ncbi:MAG: glycosyltransferase family 2 protein [Acidimicrobiia bacterium]